MHHRLFVRGNHRHSCCDRRTLISLWALYFWFGLGAFAQSATSPMNLDAPFSIRATHLLGFENTKSNCGGTLSIQGNELQFQQDGKPSAKIEITSVRDVFLNDESRQIGGLPMTLGKAAAPFGGGRVISLFAHKDYDILTLEYTDVEGGVHGAIFQISKGQGELARNELVARGVPSSSFNDQRTKQSTAEVTHENK